MVREKGEIVVSYEERKGLKRREIARSFKRKLEKKKMQNEGGFKPPEKGNVQDSS